MDIEKMTQKSLCLGSCDGFAEHSRLYVESVTIEKELKLELLKLLKLSWRYFEISGLLDRYETVISAAFTFILTVIIAIILIIGESISFLEAYQTGSILEYIDDDNEKKEIESGSISEYIDDDNEKKEIESGSILEYVDDDDEKKEIEIGYNVQYVEDYNVKFLEDYNQYSSNEELDSMNEKLPNTGVQLSEWKSITTNIADRTTVIIDDVVDDDDDDW